jgi:hypothetical protein
MGVRSPRGWSAFKRKRVRHLRIFATMILLTFTSLLQAWVPFKRWSGILGNVTPVPVEWLGKTTPRLPRRAANSTEQKVAYLVSRASEKLFWEPSCLAQATAAQMLLRRHHSGGVVVIGLRKKAAEPSSGPAKDEWMAHAWLLGQEGALSGGAAAEGFIATTLFSVPQGVQASEVSRQLSDDNGH